MAGEGLGDFVGPAEGEIKTVKRAKCSYENDDLKCFFRASHRFRSFEFVAGFSWLMSGFPPIRLRSRLCAGMTTTAGFATRCQARISLPENVHGRCRFVRSADDFICTVRYGVDIDRMEWLLP